MSTANKREILISTMTCQGFDREFASLIADSLGSEKSINRMLQYIRLAHPASAEEVADEMFAIISDRERWKQKKISEYYNMRYNAFLNSNLNSCEDCEPYDPEDSSI